MSEEKLNVNYIREKTGLVENDELIPIILKMIKDSYKSGLCQSEFDNTMGLIEENQSLKKQVEDSDFKIANLTMDKIELNKQLEEKEKIACNWKDSCLENAGKIEKLENQQKKFIEYLENYIKEMSIQNINSNPSRQIILEAIIDTLKVNLAKYKEIIGVSNEN